METPNIKKIGLLILIIVVILIINNYFINSNMNNVTEGFELTNCNFEGKTEIKYDDVQICKIVESINIPSTVTEIKDYAFSGSPLSTITFSNKSKLSSIGINAFSETKLISIIIPSSVNYIYDYAFASCDKLTSVEFEPRSSAISIAQNAFYDCKNIKTVTNLPNYPYNLEKLFTYSDSPPEITIYTWINILIPAPTIQMPTTQMPTTQVPTTPMPTTQMPTTQMPTTQMPTTQMPTTPMPTTQMPTTQMPTTQMPTTPMPTTPMPTTQMPTTPMPTTPMPTTQMPTTQMPTTQMPTTPMPTTPRPIGCNNPIIPPGTTSINDNTFKGCINLETITIPSSVRQIGKSAFEGCTKLKSITFQKNSELISIGTLAFKDCKNLKTITNLPNKLKPLIKRLLNI
jgi:hypothetical protein